ncbi:MAG: DoxX family protein [Pseudomonadota bacterium]
MSPMKIIQAILQGLISLVFVAAGVMNLTGGMESALLDLGYPAYLSTIIGGGYLFGVIFLYQPFVPVLQEWALGGMAVALVGAASSHILHGDPFTAYVPALALILVFVIAAVLRYRT